MVTQYEDKRGNRAMLDYDGVSYVMIVNPSYRKSAHGRPQPTFVHSFTTEWAALNAMSTLTGTKWTEVRA